MRRPGGCRELPGAWPVADGLTPADAGPGPQAPQNNKEIRIYGGLDNG